MNTLIEVDREKVLEGIRMNADVVGSTMGPGGRNVTVDMGGGMATFKDGVSVSRSLQFSDPWKRIGSQIVRSACMRTVEEAGDGTTATAVMCGVLCELEGEGFALERRLRRQLAEVEGMVRDAAVPVVVDGVINEAVLRAVARVSANGREDLGDMISGMCARLGVHGMISVEAGSVLEGEVLPGYGYTGRVYAREFLNRGGDLVLENPRVVLINEDVTDMRKLARVLEWNQKSSGPLVLVCGGAGGQALASLAAHIGQGGAIYMVSAPEFGELRHEMMADLGAICGCVVYNHMRGVELKDFGRLNVRGSDGSESAFGRCDRIEVKGGRVFVFGSAPAEYVSGVTDPRRLALLSGGVGVIRVGGATEMEVTADRELVDDAVRAVYSAMDGGVVPGAGRMLSWCAGRVEGEIVEALRAPRRRVFGNAGVFAVEEAGDLWEARSLDGEVVNYMAEGILDPAKVVISSLRNAVSAASQFLTTAYFLSLGR